VQPLKKFSAFYETQKLITVLTRDWYLSRATSVQSTAPQPVSPRSVLGLLTGSFTSGVPSNSLYGFRFSIHSYYKPYPLLFSWLGHSKYDRRRMQIMKFFSILLSPASCHFIKFESSRDFEQRTGSRGVLVRIDPGSSQFEIQFEIQFESCPEEL
jgi:hypothetical protein